MRRCRRRGRDDWGERVGVAVSSHMLVGGWIVD